MTGYIKQIETMGIHDGPGIRTIFFMQGCPLRCLYCHNPEMLEYSIEEQESYTPKQVLEIVLRYKNYYGPLGGVTFSGGEPLLQSEFILTCVLLLKEHGITTAIDTAGSVINSFTRTLLEKIDLIIYDVKAVDDQEFELITRCKQDTTKRFLDLVQSLDKPLWIRQVIIPGLNDDMNHIKKLANYLNAIKNIKKIELLPYHTFGEAKYEKLGIDYPLKDKPPMGKDKCREFESYLMSNVKLS